MITNLEETATKIGDTETIRRHVDLVGPGGLDGCITTTVRTSPIESVTRLPELRGERREYSLSFELASPVPFKYTGRELDRAIRVAVAEVVTRLSEHDSNCDLLDVDPAIGRPTKPCNCRRVTGVDFAIDPPTVVVQ